MHNSARIWITLTWVGLVAGSIIGCSQRLRERDVEAFMDKADAAERARVAPDICALRAEGFRQHVIFHGAFQQGPSEMTFDRRLFCSQAGHFAHVRQYSLERRSLHIELAQDCLTAKVDTQYTEKLPFY